MTVLKWGDEQQLATDSVLNIQESESASVAALADGGYVVVFGDVASPAYTAVERFDATGHLIESFEIEDNFGNPASDPHVSALANGGFTVSIVDQTGGRSENYNYSASNALTGEFVDSANTPTFGMRYGGLAEFGSNTLSTSVISGNSNFYIFVADFDASGNGGYLTGSTYNSSYVEANSDLGVTDSQGLPSVTSIDGGQEFAVSWTDSTAGTIEYRVFNADGSAVTASTVASSPSEFIDTYGPSNIVGLADGGFVIAWSAYTNTSDYDVYAKMFDSSGTATTAEFRVNALTTNYQAMPQITALADGGFVVVWTDAATAAGVNEYNRIEGQEFDAFGNRVGTQFQANTTDGSYSQSPHIAALSDGRLLIEWQTEDANGHFGVFTQIVDPRDGVITGDAGNNVLYGNDSVSDEINGLDGNDTLYGLNGDDHLIGGAGNDLLVAGGGNDTVSGGSGNDVIQMDDNFNAADHIDGGADSDEVTLNGDYSLGVVFNATTMVNVEEIVLAMGNNYKLTTNDATVAAGATLTVDASALGGGNTLVFNGLAETNGSFAVTGGAGADTINGGAQNDALSGGAGADTFNLSAGGNDTVSGGNDNDTFSFAGAFTAADTVDGGAGTDSLTLNGDYSAGITFLASTMVNVEGIYVAAGHNYKLTTVDANVASGATLTVNAAGLAAANTLFFNGTAETNGKFILVGGAGADTLYGGAGNDSITGGGGADTIKGGAGSNTFVYGAVSDSTSTGFDSIYSLNFTNDKFDVTGTITGIDAAVTTGTVYSGAFDANLTTALSGHLLANHAILFTPNVGTYAGQEFLVIDQNGVAGYQAGADLVIHVVTPAGTLAVGDFI